MVLRDSFVAGVIQPDARIYTTTDANYDVTALITYNAATQTWGISERFVYSPYGSVQALDANFVSTADAFNWQYMYQGGRFDSAIGLYHFGARDYSPTLGVWTSQDPMQYINGANTYQFVMSNPAGRVDPWGQWKINRNGKVTAVATSQAGDTIAGLAEMLHLNPAEWTKWSTVLSGTPPANVAAGIASGCLKLCIPNTVDVDLGSSADWARALNPLDILGMFAQESRMLGRHYRSKGFYVAYDVGATDATMAIQLEGGTRNKELYAFAAFGHGVEGVINANGLLGLVPGRYTAYGIAKMWLGFCESLNPGVTPSIPQPGGLPPLPAGVVSQWAENVAPDGRLVGYVGSASYTTFVSHLVEEPGIVTTLPLIPNPASTP
jgi:RHS repeat-associated protein